MSSCSTSRKLGVLCLTSALWVAGCASRANNDPFTQGLRFDPRPPETTAPQNSTPGDWSRVDRVPRGTTLEARRLDGTEVRGEFEGSDATEIRLDTGASAVRILKSDVQEVRAEGGHRLRNILLAAGIGGAAGLLIWAAADGELVERSLVGMMIGGGGGAAGAALWPSSEVLYEAPEESP